MIDVGWDYNVIYIPAVAINKNCNNSRVTCRGYVAQALTRFRAAAILWHSCYKPDLSLHFCEQHNSHL